MLFEGHRSIVHLPARRTVYLWRGREHRCEALKCEAHLPLGPGRVAMGDEVLPRDVIVTMHANFKTGVTHAAHFIAGVPTNIRPGEQGAVEQRAKPVVFKHIGSRNLAQEPRAEHAADGAAGVIRA